MTTRTLFRSALATTAIGLAPLLIMLIAGMIAGANGCRIALNEVSTCTMRGREIGPGLAAVADFAERIGATLWLLPVATALWVALAVRRRRERIA